MNLILSYKMTHQKYYYTQTFKRMKRGKYTCKKEIEHIVGAWSNSMQTITIWVVKQFLLWEGYFEHWVPFNSIVS